MQVKLAFQPELHDITYVDNFEVLAVGMASKSRIKCIGVAQGPNVQMETSAVNFGIVKPFSQITRSFKLHNKSNMTAIFQVNLFRYLWSKVTRLGLSLPRVASGYPLAVNCHRFPL